MTLNVDTSNKNLKEHDGNFELFIILNKQIIELLNLELSWNMSYDGNRHFLK